MATAEKRLGQHFLSDPEIAEKIVDALDVQKSDIVIEIGPGHGELTDELRSKNKELRIIAGEKDGELVKFLKEKFKGDKNTEIIAGDVLKILPSIIHDSQFIIQNYKIAGNIPYYITGKLLRVIGELPKKPELTVLMVQKEVAERICAKPPKMNLLAAAAQFWADAEIIGFVPRKHFRPAPKVDSAIIKLTTNEKRLAAEEKGAYYKFIKAAFAQPRKTLLNNLSAGLKIDKARVSEILKENGIPPSARPQDLGVKNMIKLSRFATKIKGGGDEKSNR